MRIIVIAFMLSLLLSFSFNSAPAAFVVSLSHSREKVPDYLKVKNFIRMSVPDFQKASGHKLNFLQKIYFKKLQKKLRKAGISQDTTILPFYDLQKGKFKFDSLWFILGIIIGPFAILFSFTSRQDRSKRISALIGFGVWVLWFGWIFLF